jgi:DNA-binding FadR family transcriptional regulator
MRYFAIILFVLISSEALAFQWPWESRYRYHKQYREPNVPVLPDCRQINEAVAALDPEHLERALRLSNEFQREAIAKCQTMVR